MIHISTVGRLSLGLVLLTISILFGADMFGLIPDRSKSIISQRQGSCESLAVYCAVEAKKGDTESIMTALKMIVKRNDDILSAAIRKEDGSFMVAAGDHVRHWKDAPSENSTPTHVRVPIFEGNKLWGDIEVSFLPIRQKGIAGLWANTLVKLICFVILAGSIVYRFFLKKTLQHLDPSSVVPPRVKAALDTLAEGVLIMDQHERIVLANTALAEKVGTTPSLLMGKTASGMSWAVPKSDKTVQEFPWTTALREGLSQLGIRMGLPTQTGDWLAFLVNSAPIMDGKGKCKGVIATFDDVTQLEKKNDQLQTMLKNLEISRDEIRRKNKELHTLAMRDSLTNCLNRRAFFERIDGDFSSAKRYGHDLSCIMVDIDHFKSVNDNHGHAAGDQVLKGVAKILRDLKRKPDYVCRYGGEEFVIVLPHADIKGAMEVAERIRNAIESKDFSGISITSSLGVSSSHFGANSSSEIIAQADKALYSGKEGGRNCVVSWEKLAPGTGTESPESEKSAETVSIDAGDTALSVVAGSVSKNVNGHSDAPVEKDNIYPVVGEDYELSNINEEALELVSQALDGSAKTSRALGLHASFEKDRDVAVQLNQDGGWGDSGELDKKDRFQESSISQAARILKQSRLKIQKD
jgi:diguanylate cyclase (GGDEF)-like protein/PAS domain S-box-containing protein